MSSAEASRKFHFLREIAAGGFGSVYLVKLIQPDGFTRVVAVKLLHDKWSENEEVASRMRDEARLLGWLRHRHIVDVMDLTRIDGRVAVIMEYLDSVDLKVVVQALAAEKRTIPLRVACEMCAAVGSALDAAYNRPPYAGEKPLRVIHRDIKPSNVMIDDQGTIKVLDFGGARAEFDERESKTQDMSFGSLEYMPPERLFFEPESHLSDVYSLGATLFETIALEPFGKARLRKEEHELYFEERFDLLLKMLPGISQEREDILHDLLWDTLDFVDDERPDAADVVVRLRAFARQVGGIGLQEWAERNVGPIVRAQQAKPAGPPDNVVGRVLSEDSRSSMDLSAVPLPPDEPEEEDGALDDDATMMMSIAPKHATLSDATTRLSPVLPADVLASLGAERLVETERMPAPFAGGIPEPAQSNRSAKPAELEEDVDATVTRDDQRWLALREATIAEMEKTGEIPALPKAPKTPDQPAQGAPKAASGASGGSPRRGAPSAAPPPMPPPAPPPVPAGLRSVASSNFSLGEISAAAPAVPPKPSPERSMDGEGAFVAPALTSATPAPGEAAAPSRSSEVPAKRRRARPTAPELSVPPPRPEPVPPPARGGLLTRVVLILFVLVGLGLVGLGLLAVFGAAGGLVFTTTMSGAPAPAPVVSPAPSVAQPSAPAAPVQAAPPAGAAATFHSAMPSTRKLQVRCDNGSGSGVDQAFIEAPTPGDCTVTALGEGRSRATALVKNVELRPYECFVDGEQACH